MIPPHTRLTDELRERAQLYALGSLPEPERDDFGRHLADGCAVCAAEVRANERLAAEVALAAPPRAARPELKIRLGERLQRERAAAAAAGGEAAPVQAWKQWAPMGPIDALIRHDETPFEPTGAPGISVRRLFVDAQRRSATMLVRMEPGADYPGHRHGGTEECYVLSGDLRHGDRVMRGGDFEVVAEGSRHGRQWTEEGCLLLIRSSLADELTA